MVQRNRVCVIGYGYVGSALVDYFSKKSELFEVTCVTRNKPDNSFDNSCNNSCNVNFVITSYDRMCKEFYSQFDTIVLTAGQSSPSSSENLLQVVYNDILAFSYILEIIADTQKLVYLSSAALYGDTCGRIVDENESICIQNYYDLGKQARDSICLLNPQKQIFGLRIGTLAGPAPITRTDLIINKMVNDAQTSGEVSIGCVNRSIIGVNDLCRAVHAIIVSGNVERSGIYNMCSFNSDAMAISNKIQEHFPSTRITEFNATSPYNFLLDSSKFCETFHFKFEDTIDSIINDLKKSLQDVTHNTIKKPKLLYSIVSQCRVCDTQTSELLNLGHQPLANNYHTMNENINWYPLCLHYCPNCFHVQLNCTVDPEILFKNYLYVSGTSNTGKKYFSNFAQRTIERLRDLDRLPLKQLRVLDIACNDGSQLDAFQKVCEKEGIDVITVGVDPAKNLYNVSSSKGHTIHCDFFNEQLSASLKTIYGEFDVIIAQNVFAHVDSPGEFLDGCRNLMHDKSMTYIQTSQAKMIENGEWDTAYHEHLSFFNGNSMNTLCKKIGVSLNKIDFTPIHGTSYLFEITNIPTNDTNTIDVIYEEMIKGLYSNETYTAYTLKCQIYKNEFHNKLLKYKLDGYNIAAFGSTAKFNTVLNSASIDNTLISYIIDENPLKQGLLAPGSNIPVAPISFLDTLQSETVIIVSAWNFYNEIKEKLTSILKNQSLQRDNIKLLNLNPLQEEDITHLINPLISLPDEKEEIESFLYNI